MEIRDSERIVVCNTGTNGKSHARVWDSDITLCGKHIFIGNKGEEKLNLSQVECQRCRNGLNSITLSKGE